MPPQRRGPPALHEAELVAVDDDHRRRVDRPAAFGRPGEIEELQRVDRLPHDREHGDRPERRQDHVPEHAEPARAVDAGGLGLVVRDVLQRREIDQDVEPDGGPGVDGREQEERPVGIVEELLAGQSHPREAVVDDAVLRVEDVEEDHAGRGRGGHERHEEARAVEADEADLLVEQQRQTEPEQHRRRHVQQRELERAADGVEPLRVMRELAVVGEADAALGPEAARGLGREQERPDDREEPEPEHDASTPGARTPSRSGSRGAPSAMRAGGDARLPRPPRLA